jgi:hypothetical protein
MTPWETLGRDLNQTPNPSSLPLFSRTSGGKQWKLTKPANGSDVFISVNGQKPSKPATSKGAEADAYIQNGLTLRAQNKDKTQPPKPLDPALQDQTFVLGAGLRGEVVSADADNVTIQLKRFSVSGYAGDATKRELLELFRRILKPDILKQDTLKPAPQITMSQSLIALDRRQQLLLEIYPPSLAEFSSKSVETFVEKSLNYLQDGSNGERAAFEFKVAGVSLEQVFKDVTDTAWNRLGEFTGKNSRGWAPYRHSRFCGNLILEGVPGTGKTYALKELANELGNRKTIAVGRLATVMHPATSYEDFVEGLRPGTPAPYSGASEFDDAAPEIAVDDQADQTADASAPAKWFFEPATEASGDFQIYDGFFVAACAAAVRNPNTPYVVLLDELNRCNIPKVMGDLITTMEISKRAKWDAAKKQWDLSSAQVVTLPYSKRLFFVPDNLSIVGTMNTTDRSVAPMDAALRRRFVFVRVKPELDHKDLVHAAIRGPRGARWRLSQLNDALETYLGPDAMLGHSYLFDLQAELKSAKPEQHDEIVKFCFKSVIFPMVVDTLVNHGCIAELGARQTKESREFLTKLEEAATVKPAGRGITQTLKLTWKDAPAPASPTADPSDDGTPEN